MKTIDDLALLLDTPNAFRDWLESLPPESPAGYIEDPRSCPIARFCNGNGFPGARISHIAISIYPPDETDAPPWVERFVTKIDTYQPSEDWVFDDGTEPEGELWDGAVPASVALETLNGVIHA